MPGSCFKFPAKSHNLKVVLVFIDFKQAFGSVHRGRMPQILRAYFFLFFFPFIFCTSTATSIPIKYYYEYTKYISYNTLLMADTKTV